MNIYDKAHDLAAALKDSPEVAEITDALKLIEADPEGKRMLDDFRVRQNAAQQRMMAGKCRLPKKWNRWRSSSRR